MLYLCASEMSGCFDCLLCKQAKKHYEKAFRDAEKAQDAHKRAENDVNLSKADVEKVDYQSRVELWFSVLGLWIGSR